MLRHHAGAHPAIAEAVKGKRPGAPAIHSQTLVSGMELLEADDDNRPVIVGERTNVIGSRKFKHLVAEGSSKTPPRSRAPR